MKLVLHRFLQISMLTALSILTSCNDHSDDAIIWLNNLETGTSLESIKESQPDFIEIDWNKPDTAGYKSYYKVSVDGSTNILNKTHELVFIRGRFQGCSHHRK
jgi:hypothetical protein